MLEFFKKRREQNQDILVSAVVEMIDERMQSIFKAAAKETRSVLQQRPAIDHSILDTTVSTFEVFTILQAATEIYESLRYSEESAADLANTTLNNLLRKRLSVTETNSKIQAAFSLCEAFNPVARKAQFWSVAAASDIANTALSDSDLENRYALQDLLLDSALGARPAANCDALCLPPQATS